MNVLAILSAISAYSFVLTAIYILKLNWRESLNRTAALVNISFALWSFCYIFFHAAANESGAWLWHRLSAAGWVPFCAFAVHFFFILSGKRDAWKSRWPIAAIYALPLPLLFYAFFGKYTPVAKGLVRTPAGTEWTYVSNADSPWLWAYIAYVVGYFSVGLYFARQWTRSRDRSPRQKRQGNAIIALDLIVIGSSFFTDLAAPMLGLKLAPVGNLLTVGWMVGFLFIISKYKLMTIHEAANADLILDTIMDPVLLLDKKGIIQKCNRGCAALLKHPESEIEGKPFSLFLASKRYRQNSIDILLSRKRLSQIELTLIDANEEKIHVLGSMSLAETMLDGLIGIVVNLHDIGILKKTQGELIRKEEESRALAADLHRIAHYDTLTDLPNRRLFFERLSEALAHHERTGKPFVVVFADLDGFKAINDGRGHDVGDALLATVADRLRAILLPEDSAARVGGDEFVVLLRGERGDAADAEIAALVREPFVEPIFIAGLPCPIGVSIGIARCPDDGADADSLMKAADERMYAEKRLRKSSKEPRPHFHAGDA